MYSKYIRGIFLQKHLKAHIDYTTCTSICALSLVNNYINPIITKTIPLINKADIEKTDKIIIQQHYKEFISSTLKFLGNCIPELIRELKQIILQKQPYLTNTGENKLKFTVKQPIEHRTYIHKNHLTIKRKATSFNPLLSMQNWFQKSWHHTITNKIFVSCIIISPLLTNGKSVFIL